MKIVKKDTKHGKLVIKPEVLDDLWVLEKIIEKNDLISGKTFRSITMTRDGMNIKTGRRPVFLKINAESVEFNEHELRVKGKILEGPDEVSHGYHTFEIKPDNIVTIEKEWKQWQIQKLEKAAVKPVKILACVLDEKEADFALIGNKVDMLASIRGPSGKSFDGHEEIKKKYYAEIIEYIRNKLETGKYEKVVIAGPGFTKENIYNIIKEDKSLVNKIITDSVSHTGIAGIRELINRGAIDQIVKESDVSFQTQIIDEFFVQIAKDGLVEYGLNGSRSAIENGNAEMLLIADTEVHENEELIDMAEKLKTKVHIIDTQHEAGKRFSLFGGIAVFLRYKI
tara:strand:- start:813 stop:1829 length:1017 start_codon:yes stop_codon:yes gene_type:complete